MELAAVRRVVAAYQPSSLEPGISRRAAVLVPLRVGREAAAEVILTRRTSTLEEHAGQVAFPGGHMEATEAPEAAALREMHEELGVPSSMVEVVGRLDETYTVTGFHITPVVAVVASEAALLPEPREVARVFCVPLEVLLSQGSWQLREHRYEGQLFRVWHVPYADEDIWGATARILRDFVELLWSAK